MTRKGIKDVFAALSETEIIIEISRAFKGSRDFYRFPLLINAGDKKVIIGERIRSYCY